MKTAFSLSLLSGLGVLSASGLPCLAQATPAPAPTTRKIRAASPVANQVTVAFSVSASIGASATGEAGAYLPSSASVSPQEKNYYVALNASLVVPSDMDESLLPTTIRLQARRFRNETSPTGQVQRNYMGETRDDLPVLHRFANPTANQYSRTYTYGTFEPDNHENQEQGEARRATSDWNVSQVKGRWELRVHPDDGPSNTVDVKINKRTQIVTIAESWVNYYQYRRANAPDETEFNDWSSKEHPDGLFTHCFSFVSYIYGRCGLNIPGDDGKGVLAIATALDDNPGSLRFYWTPRTPPFPADDPGHIAIIANSLLGFPKRIDNNGRPAADDGSIGPTWRPLDQGVGDVYDVYAGPDSIRPPVSRTLAGETNPSISLLQELDAE